MTTKPILYVANVSEDDVADADANHYVQEVRNFAAEENAEVIRSALVQKKKSQN